jgi:hypothetical protein
MASRTPIIHTVDHNGSGGRYDAGSERAADAGATVALPSRPGWDTYVYVFEGAVTVGEGADPVGYTESALVTGDGDVPVTATEDSVLVAFALDPDAPVTRRETIGR